MDIYFISEFNDKGNNAGSKARNDMEEIFNNRRWLKINNSAIVAASKKRNIIYFLKSFISASQLFFKMVSIKKSIIFCQYPVLKGSILYHALNIASKNNNICYLIHDINALRAPEERRKDLLDKEIAILNKATAVIVHNDSMRDVLKRNGLTTKIVENLYLFDYLAHNYRSISRKLSRTIVYAGNLKKGSFLDELIKKRVLNFHLNLYGPNYDGSNINNSYINFKGNFPPDEVVDKLEGSFGLVWDGPGIDTCSGIYGEYTRYNNPHKFSLYIAAGLPIIAWSQSAIAKVVTEYNIGFTVNSILEIPDKLDNLNDMIYDEYIMNINNIREKVCSGYYTDNAIDRVIKGIEVLNIK